MEIDRNRPRMMRTGSESLTPAMATMLSRLMMKSAMAIRVMALKSVVGAGLLSSVDSDSSWTSLQAIQTRSRAPTNRRPGKSRRSRDDEGQRDPHRDRHAAAPDHRLPALAGGQHVGRQADDDGVVAREDQVEQDDLEDGGQVIERHEQAWSGWETRQSDPMSIAGPGQRSAAGTAAILVPLGPRLVPAGSSHAEAAIASSPSLAAAMRD